MGIQGLLPLLKSIMNPIHIKELDGCFVAVDTYSWLHKGALSCSTDLCKGQPTSKHIDYCMHRVNMLRHYGVKPILVLDGGPLPMKSDQEIKRARSRKENFSRALEHEANGNRSAAYECYQKAVDISPSVAYDLIQVLKKENVSYVVAPYEADAQMTFLALNKHVDAVITEDSDLIAFGCPRIIYKMDKFGQGVEFKNTMLQYNKELNLSGFNQMMLLEMCILSGCDYLQSLPGMGLKKAHALMKKFKSHENVIKHLKYSNIEVPPFYEESFKKAILTFKHQRVYDPISEGIVHLSEPADIIVDDLDFLGPSITSLPQHVAKGIAQGDLDPFTKVPIVQKEAGAAEEVLHGTYQLKNFKPDSQRKKLDLPVQKNLLTNYFCIQIRFSTLEARRKFKAPRVINNNRNECKKASGLHIDVHEVKHGGETNDLKYTEAQEHAEGSHDDKGIEMKPFTKVQNAVCKPCISLHKEYPDQETGKAASRNKNVIVRSSYFSKKSRDENDKENKNDDSKLDVGTCRKEEKRVVVKSRYFRQKNTESSNCEGEESKEKYSVQAHRFDLDDSDCQRSVGNRKHRMRSSYVEEVSVDENNSLEFSNTIKKRKIAHTDSLVEDANDDNKLSTDISGACTSDLEEDPKHEGEKLACNINHLDRYSNIAEKSIEKFVSVLSSFKYSFSGSRVSGLRAPLKDIENNSNNCMHRKFVCAPTKRTTASRCRKK
ncbi:hypothetical protein OROMI_022165 [Orobanche minor]